jgi:hypothetical protein
VDFGVKDQRPITFSISGRYWRKDGSIMSQYISYLQISRSLRLRREVLHSILTEFGLPKKLVGLIKMCLNETCSTAHTGKYQSDKFPI